MTVTVSSFKWTFFAKCLLLLVMCQVTGSRGAQEGSSQGDSSNSANFSSTATILVSVGVVMGGFMFAAICAFSWWRRQYRKLCPGEPPMDDPVATFGGEEEMSNRSRNNGNSSYGTMRSLDVSTLESDTGVISIEPFPPLDVLTNVVSRYNVTETGDARMSFESMDSNNHLHAILYPDDDPNIYAHDWFENETLKFPRRNINYMQELGAGWFGLVIESEASEIQPFPRRSKVIVQVLRDEATERDQMIFLDQARVYRDSNHKNIMKLMGHCLESIPYLLVMENYPRGDLKGYLLTHASGPILLDSQGANARNKMALDIANGLDWMHSNGFTHPDLSARNCLVGGDGQVVIGDYGLAKTLYREDYYWGSGGSGGGRDVGLSIRWGAPESMTVTSSSIATQKATPEGNVWSFGVVVWEICELAKYPYAELTDELVLSRVVTDRNYTLKHPSIAQLPFMTLRDKMINILTSCHHGVPSKRPTINQLVQLLNTPL